MSNDDSNLVDRRSALVQAGVAVAGLTMLAATEAASQESGSIQQTSAPLRSTVRDTPLPPEPAAEQAGTGARGQLLNGPPVAVDGTRAQDRVSIARSPEEDAAFRDVMAFARTQLGVTSDDSVTGNLAENFRSIEHGLNVSVDSTETTYSPLHVEHLLGQAAELFERGIKDRSEWDEKAARSLGLALELQEYDELYRIHQEEDSAGFYDLPTFVSSAEFAAENLTAQQNDFIARFLDSILDQKFSAAAVNTQSGDAQRLAWLSGVLTASFEGQKFTGYTTHTWNGVANTVAEHAKQAAASQANFDLGVQRDSARVQAQIYRMFSQVSRRRLPGLDSKLKWDMLDSQFRRRRTNAARRIQDLKAKAVTDDNGALNFSKRMVALKKRFEEDFREAYARLLAVSEGMKSLYGYERSIPAPSSPDFFDDCLLWARSAINWLVRFSNHEQSYAIPISVRQLTGESRWSSALRAGEDLEFIVAESMFPEHHHLRLRGLSACVVIQDDDEDTLYSLAMQVPRTAVTRHLSGQAVELDQSTIPTCWSSRVAVRNATREPDIVGTLALHNASPLGQWRVKVGSHKTGRRLVQQLRDIQIDLHVIFRTA